MRTPSKTIRRGIVLLELLILALAVTRQDQLAAAPPAYYQIEAATTGIYLRELETGVFTVTPLLDFSAGVDCVVEIRLNDDMTFNYYSLNGTHSAIIFDFWSANTEVLHQANGSTVRFNDMTLTLVFVDCGLLLPADG